VDIIGIIMQVAVSVGVALALGLWIYLSKWQKSREPFNALKFIRTLIVAGILGGVAWYSGFTLTPENWDGYLAANAGAIAFADQGLKMLLNLLGLKLPDGV